MTKPTKKLTQDQQQLVNEHLGLVETLARRHRKWESSYRAEYDDLLGEGYIALIEAAISWKPELGPFKPWAIRGIKHQFSKADRKEHFPVHLSATAHGIIRAIRNAQLHGYTTSSTISAFTGINEDKIIELLPYSVAPVTLTAVGESSDFNDNTIVLVDESETPEDTVMVQAERDIVREAVDVLPEPQRAIIAARFGFTTGDPMVSSEIQAFLGVDAETVREAEAQAMVALETALRLAGLDR
jgi:RNA polymerase sigma factor (sigma-70 family)